MVYFANSQHILHNRNSTSHFSIRGGTTGKSCEGWMGPIQMGTHVTSVSIRGGTAWKSCEGWMGPNPKGTHHRIYVSPRFAIHGCSTL
jgi:hypothetical protein